MKQPTETPQPAASEQIRPDEKTVQKAPEQRELKDEQLDEITGGTADDWRCHIHPN